jgi:hypothetical protein
MSDYAEKYPTIREWRRQILGDAATKTPRSTAALDDLINTWSDLCAETRSRLRSNKSEPCEPRGLYNITFLIATICDVGPASIDPTPITDFYEMIASIRARQFIKSGLQPANVTEETFGELRSLEQKCYSIANRLRHAWVAMESIPEPESLDEEQDEADGPAGINQWRHNGILSTGRLNGKPYHIASYLFARIQRKVPLSDLHSEFWKDKTVGDETITRQGRTAAAWFIDQTPPIMLDIKSGDGMIWMEKITTEE